MFSKELPIKILKLIDQKEMTIEALSVASGLSRKYITNITGGKQIPTLTSLEKLCSALEVDPNYLLINEKSKDKERSEAMFVDTVYCNNQSDTDVYIPICPQCNSLLHNSWESYCDNCGQKLSWKEFLKSKTVMIKPQRKKQRNDKKCK